MEKFDSNVFFGGTSAENMVQVFASETCTEYSKMKLFQVKLFVSVLYEKAQDHCAEHEKLSMKLVPPLETLVCRR